MLHPPTHIKSQGLGSLILSLSVNLETLLNEGTAYPWPRPPCCPRCKEGRLWGHGYVSRFFDGLERPLLVKRWRCPSCRAVHTMRPSSHWRGFWATVALIVSSLQAKFERGRWLPTVSRQRQQYWWHGLQRQRYLQGPAVELSQLLAGGVIAATHSLSFRRVVPLAEDPYRIFAVTAAQPLP